MTTTAVVDRPADSTAEAGVQAQAQAAPKKKRGGGPQSPEGRRASSANSLKFGLMARTIFPADLQRAIDLCTAELMAQFLPRSDYEKKQVLEMGRAMAQLELCEK